MVKDEFVRRHILHTSAEIFNQAYDPTIEINEILGKSRNVIDTLCLESVIKPKDATGIKKGLSELLKELQAEPDHGVPSGFIDVDRLIYGFQKGTMTLISGCTSIGKSQFIQNVIQHNMDDYWTLYFSTEMSKRHIQMRFLASEAGTTTKRLAERDFSDDMWSSLTMAANKISQSKILIFDDLRNLRDIWDAIRWYKTLGKADFVVIDHLLHLKPLNNYSSKLDEVSAISSDLLNMAIVEEMPIVALSHLSRSIFNRPNKRPALSDLRESGMLENNADRVIFLHREDYHTFMGTGEKTKNATTEIILAKDRIFGNVGTVELVFVDGSYRDSYMKGD